MATCFIGNSTAIQEMFKRVAEQSRNHLEWSLGRLSAIISKLGSFAEGLFGFLTAMGTVAVQYPR